jgi:hypothetical protein
MSQRNTLYNHGNKNKNKDDDENKDDRLTPSWILDKLPDVFGHRYYLDPCPGPHPERNHSLITDAPENGLSYDWGEVSSYSFVQPPFSQMMDWVEHSIKCTRDGDHHSLWFVKWDTRTVWGQMLADNFIAWRQTRKYIRYLDVNLNEFHSATFQTCFGIMGRPNGTAIELWSRVLECYGDRLISKPIFD